MTIQFLLYFILSTALSKSNSIAILYSRSSLIIYFFSIILIYTSIEWHFFEKSNSIYNSLLYFDLINLVMILFIMLLVLIILCLTSYYPCKQKNNVSTSNYVKSLINPSLDNLLQASRAHYKIIEYPLIIQFIVIGSISLVSCNDLITMFLCIELQSYGLYIFSTIYRNSEQSTEAGLTYFLLGGLSSCIILLGQSFIYINSGITGLDGLYIMHNIITSDINYIYSFFSSFFTNNSPIVSLNFYQYQILLSFIVLTVGFLFKISAAPFHSWSPGVYDAVPTVTTTFIAIIPKVSILVLLFDLVYHTWYTTFDYSWTNILLFSSFLSLIIGSVLGLTQLKIKRLYAYSTISHVGFILLALSIHSVESVQAFFFYIIQYSLTNVNAFFILILIGYVQVYYKEKTKSYQSMYSLYKVYKEKLDNLSPIEFIQQLKGYIYLNPILAISFSITLYSFIGVPPLVGFFAKQMVLSSALDNGTIFMCFIAIITSVISAVYYLYIIKHMFFEKSIYTINDINLDLPEGDKLIPLQKLNTPSNISIFIISILTFLSIFFLFLYYEIYFLMNILSILLIY